MPGAGSSRIWLSKIVPWLIVAVSIIVGYQATRPPNPAAPTTAAQFSATRAFEHVQAIAVSPHPMGSAAIAEVRSYLVGTLGDLGIATELQTAVGRDYYNGTASPVDVVNVIARIPGTNSSGTIALIAHYDTHPNTPGANDNTVAVAALLETARLLTDDAPLQNDVLLLFTDAEEPAPRWGSTAFVTEAPAFDDIKLVVNLEASGGSGASVLAEINGPERWLINELKHADPHPAAFSSLTAMTRMLGEIGTDFDEFRNAGVAGMHFAYLHGSPIYHTESDNIESVDKGSLQHHGNHALGIARHFGALDLTVPHDSARSVYFPLRPLFVTYSYPVAMLLALLATAGLGAALRHPPRQLAGEKPLRSGTVAVAVFVGSIVLGTVAWVLVVTLRPHLGTYEGYIYFGVLVATATRATGRTQRASRHGPGPGTLVPLIALTVLTAFIGVGFSYLFVWPAMATAGAIWWHGDGAARDTLRLTIVSLATLVVTVPVIDILLQFAYPRPGNPDSSVPYAVLAPLLLAVMVAHLLRGFWPNAVRGPRPE